LFSELKLSCSAFYFSKEKLTVCFLIIRHKKTAFNPDWTKDCSSIIN